MNLILNQILNPLGFSLATADGKFLIVGTRNRSVVYSGSFLQVEAWVKKHFLPKP